MSTIIHSKPRDDTSIKECTVQVMPCKIDFDGRANIDTHLNNYVAKESGTLSTSFRGHPLRGRQIQLEHDMIGVVFERCENKETGDVDLYATKKFKELKYWNWGKEPSRSDQIQKAFEYFEVAEALHKPIAE